MAGEPLSSATYVYKGNLSTSHSSARKKYNDNSASLERNKWI